LAKIAENGDHSIAPWKVIGVAWKREIYMTDQMDVFKTHLHSHLAPALAEKVLDSGVLKGLVNVIAKKKKEWTPATNMTRSTWSAL
jgi:hypothetical protein